MIFQKMIRRSPEELTFRIRQYFWNLNDRLRRKFGIKSGSLCSDENSEPGHFFIDKTDLADLRSVYEHQQPEMRLSLIQRADVICEHRFDLLGYQKLSFERDGYIDWHFDPLNAAVIPKIWWQGVMEADRLNGADPKVIWELNRHQYLVTLAQAFAISGEEKYRREVFDQLQDWMDKNPPKYGINWSSSLELAYRLIAWIWTWVLCDVINGFGELTGRFLSMLAIHAEHIENNLSVYFSPNTHLSGEALGLYYIGTVLPGLKGAQRWKTKGKRYLIECLDSHVLSDGGYMERTIWYHRYTTDIYLHFYLLGLKNKESDIERVGNKLEQIGFFLAASLQPDRRLPFIGDDDGGRLVPLDDLKGNDPRGLLRSLGVLFRNKAFNLIADECSEETLWLFGPQNASVVQEHADLTLQETSYVFPDTGFVFLRSDWTDNAIYLSFDCGPHGWRNGGHAHADMLSFQVFAGREALIRDPGTYSYQKPWRDFFRDAENHAIIRINGQYPAVPERLFHWSKVPEGKFLCFQQNEKISYAAGKMDAGDWQQVREIYLVRPYLIVVLDSIWASGEYDIEALYPLSDTGWTIDKGSCRSTFERRKCSIQWAPGTMYKIELKPSWQSAYYGQRNQAFVLRFSSRVNGLFTVATLINLSGEGYSINKHKEKGPMAFEIRRKQDNKSILTVKSSLDENRICAVFAE